MSKTGAQPPVNDPDMMTTLQDVFIAFDIKVLTCAALCCIKLGRNHTSALLLLIVGAIFVIFPKSMPSPDRFAKFLQMCSDKSRSLTPLIELTFQANSALLLVCTIGASAVFVALTLAAMISKDMFGFYLSGMLCAAVSISLLRFVLKTADRVYIDAPLYGVFCGYMLYKTHVITKKISEGDRDDPIKHAEDLFVDLVANLAHLLEKSRRWPHSTRKSLTSAP